MVRHFATPRGDDGLDAEEVVGLVRTKARESLASNRTPSLRSQLAEAFARYQRSNSKSGFAKLLARWVKRRRQAGLPVDCLDPDATEPSAFFRTFLRRQFDEVRKSL